MNAHSQQVGLITAPARARLMQKIEFLQKSLRGIGKKKGEAAGEFLTDWHDNFAYEQLDREFQMVNQRIAELNDLLQRCKMVEIAEQNEKVTIGTTVEFLLDGAENKITIGCMGESEPDLDLIAYVSPLGRLLMGLQKGDLKSGRIGEREVKVEVIRLHSPSFRYNKLQQTLDSALDPEGKSSS
jgi:transcription elongation GreA/GreB family factor